MAMKLSAVQWSTTFLLLTTLLAPTSAGILKLRATNSNPASSASLMTLLTKTEASGSADDAFTKGCLATSKAVVAESDGSKTRVASQLKLICSGLQMALDVEVCNRYRSTLLGHLHRDSRWNLEEMDFPLFCSGMDKVVGKFKEDLAAFSSGKKIAPETPFAAEEAEEESKATNSTSDHGSDDCRCVGIDEIEGETMIKLKKHGKVSFPADLGARCEAWDAETHPGCPGESWCAQKWCYVDPCKCKNVADLPKPSAYLPDAKYQGKPVHFSYATCGGKDSFSAEEEKKTAKELKKTCAVKVDSDKWGAQGCRCVGIGPQPGITKVAIKDELKKYPADTGAFCQAWEEDRHPDCKGDSPPDWCSQEWCYVDPCSCNMATPPKTSSYVPDANYQGRPVYFSYATCGGKDSWTAGNNKEACVNQKTSEDCGKLKKCGWVETKWAKMCLGKELVSVCKSEDAAQESAAWKQNAIMALTLPLLGLVY